MERGAVFKQNLQGIYRKAIIGKSIIYCLLLLLDKHQHRLDEFVFDHFDLDIIYSHILCELILKVDPVILGREFPLFNSFFLCYLSQ